MLAQTEFAGDVSGVWHPDGNPFIQIGEANIPAGERLTIQPDVEVFIGEEMTLTANGLIIAIGSEEDTIRFLGSPGVISGRILLQAERDTSQFQYCRFDSLDYGIWFEENRVVVEHSLFNNNRESLRLVGGYARCRHNHFHTDLPNLGDIKFGLGEHAGSYIVEDNFSIQRPFLFTWADNVQFNRNSTLPLDGEEDTIAGVHFWQCEWIFCSENDLKRIGINNQFRRQEELIIENNRIRILNINSNQNEGVLIRNNHIAEFVSVSNAQAEITDNTIGADRMSLLDAIVCFDHNFLRTNISIDSECELEFVNNTLISNGEHHDSAIIFPGHGNPFDGTITMINNIMVSLNYIDFAIFPSIEIADGGYNCFYGMDRIYGDRDELFDGDIVTSPLFVGGHPPEYYLRADSPCIDTGNPDSPEDPDGTRADMGLYFFDHDGGMPPTITSRHHTYTGNGMEFGYTTRAIDEGDVIEFEFEGLPEWLEVEGDGRDLISDSAVVSGVVSEDQEDFVFIIHATDEAGMEDTLSVQVFVYPYTVLTGQIGGTLSLQNSPYLIADTAWIDIEDSLIVEPGTEIYCDDTRYENRNYAILLIDGYMRAVGTEEDSIFISGLNDRIGLRFMKFRENPNVLSEFRYCHFRGAGIASSGQDFSVTNCYSEIYTTGIWGDNIHFIYQNNVGSGAGLVGSGIVADNLLINGRITVGGDSVEVYNNHFTQGSLGISIGGGIKYANIHHNIIDSCGATTIGLIIIGMEDVIRDGNIILNSNTVYNCRDGIKLEGYFSNVLIVNNLINNASGYAIRETEGEYNATISNNIFSNSALGLYLRTRDGENYSNILTENNLFINNDILFYNHRPQIEYESFRYNACFGFDSLGNDTCYIGKLTQVNANGDSCDAGFNIFFDPNIVNVDSLDFHLCENSPLINAGNPDSAFFDLDGTINDIGIYGGPFGEVYDYP